MELQPGSPYLLAFGPLFDRNVDIVTVSFRDRDGQLWILAEPPIAPRDTNQHSYELAWYEDYYEIWVDQEIVAIGQVSEDFELEGKPRYIDEPKPDDWDDREYLDEFQSDLQPIETLLLDELKVSSPESSELFNKLE